MTAKGQGHASCCCCLIPGRLQNNASILTFEGVFLRRCRLQILSQLKGLLQLIVPEVVHSQVEARFWAHIQQTGQDLSVQQLAGELLTSGWSWDCNIWRQQGCRGVFRAKLLES